MKYLFVSLFSFLLLTGNAVAQSDQSEPVNEKARADHFSIVLLKDIENLSDSTHAHHHEPHKSNFKIVHINFDVIAREGVPVESGFKTVMMRMLDAQGKDIYDPVAGGGFFLLAGKETPYTFKQSFSYDGKKQHVEFLYNNPKKYNKGLHIIEIFMDGSKIGEEHFVIK